MLSSKVNDVKDQIFDIIEKLCGERPKGRCSVGNLIPILVKKYKKVRKGKSLFLKQEEIWLKERVIDLPHPQVNRQAKMHKL